MTGHGETKVREVLPGFYLLYLPLTMRPTIVNVYLIDGGREWLLIDTGMGTKESVEAFRSALEILGCKPEWVRKIVCTHHHIDHYGASGPLQEMCRAEVYLHPTELKLASRYTLEERPPEDARFYLENGIPPSVFAATGPPRSYWEGKCFPVEPNHFLADQDRIRFGERELEVIWTPGHSPGHCVLHFAREKVAAVGDHLLPKITPQVGIASETPGDPLGDFLESLDKVAALDIETVLPAHGAVFHEHRKRVAQLINFHEYRMDVMLDGLRGRPRTAYDLALEVFELTSESGLELQFPATFETLAHMEHMRRQGRVRKMERGGRIVWAPK